jgi:hypothetical protein
MLVCKGRGGWADSPGCVVLAVKDSGNCSIHPHAMLNGPVSLASGNGFAAAYGPQECCAICKKTAGALIWDAHVQGTTG